MGMGRDEGCVCMKEVRTEAVLPSSVLVTLTSLFPAVVRI